MAVVQLLSTWMPERLTDVGAPLAYERCRRGAGLWRPDPEACAQARRPHGSGQLACRRGPTGVRRHVARAADLAVDTQPAELVLLEMFPRHATALVRARGLKESGP